MTLPIIAISILGAPAFASFAAVHEQDQTGLAGAMSDRNAASWYQRAIAKFDAALMESDHELLGDMSTPPRPEVRDLLARMQDVLALVESGSRREFSDFGLDHGDGFEMLLPHLGPMRSLTKLAAMDAAVRLHDGDGGGAAARIASIYRASSQMADDRTLISSLVGVAQFTLLDGMAQQGIESAAFSRADAAVMRESMQWIDPQDPFGLIDSLMTEQAVGTEWMARKFDEGPREFASVISFADAEDNAAREDVIAICAMSNEEFAGQIDGYDRAMSEIVEAFHEDDPAEGRRLLAKLERAVQDGEFGLLARVITPSVGRVYDRLIDARALVANRLTTLEDLASGAIAPEQLANAATWYLRAAARIESMRPEDRQALRAAALSAPVDESIAAILDDLQDALTTLEQGSKMRRCDFAAAGADVSRRLFMPAYLPAMRDGMRLMILDSARRREDGRGATRLAVERLATAMRMAAHLESDDRLLSAAVAHEGFRLALDFAEAPDRTNEDGEGGAVAADLKDDGEEIEAPALWHESALETLREAAARVGHGDPFGYIEAVEQLRAGLAERLLAMAGAHRGDDDQRASDDGATADLSGRADAAEPDDFDGEPVVNGAAAPPVAEIEAMLADYDVNQLLYAAFVLETTPIEPGEADAAASQPDPMAAGAVALAPLLNIECLEIARMDASAVRPLLEKGRIEALAAVSTLPLSNISADREAARRDLRRALRLFAPPSPHEAGAGGGKPRVGPERNSN